MRKDAVMAHQRAARRGGVPPTVVVLVVTLLSVLLGFAQKYPCNNGHPGPGVLWRQSCYTDLLPLYSGRGLNDGDIPYLDHDVEYPVLTGGLMAAVGLPVHALGESGALLRAARAVGFETVDEGVVFYWGTALVLGGLAMLTSWALLACRRDRPWDVLMWAVSPGLVLAATINWDMLAVTLTAGAILAWARERPVLAGALLGLGAAAKFYPLLLLGPLVLLCLRTRTCRNLQAASITVGAAVAAWGVVNLPVALVAPHGWAEYYRFSTKRWIDWGSLWFILDQSTHERFGGGLVHALSGDVASLNLSSWVLFVVCCLGIAALIWFAPHPPRVAATAFLVVAAFLLTNKVWSPQFVLWLIPLAVLARPRWGFFLIWQAVEIGYLMSVFRVTLGGPGDGFALEQASVARWLSVAVMAGLVVNEVLRPERDVVRAAGLADPDGGILKRTPNAPAGPLSAATAGAS
jgi:uncharacterized membrane protein